MKDKRYAEASSSSDERRRDEVIAYVKRYGEDRISQVVTYGTIKTKQALKDSARILGKVPDTTSRRSSSSVSSTRRTRTRTRSSSMRSAWRDSPASGRLCGHHGFHTLTDIIPIMKRVRRTERSSRSSTTRRVRRWVSRWTS